MNNKVPSRETCLALIKSAKMPEHIMSHSFVGEEVSTIIARLCIERGYELSIELVSAAALLHDIAKAKCIEEHCHHAEVGAEIVRAWGYPQVATIVEEHVSLSMADIIACPTESLIVNYADKRVLHDRVVSLDRRFEYLIERYGTTPQKRNLLNFKWKLYRKLEARLRQVTANDLAF